MRWRERIRTQQSVVNAPGPQRVSAAAIPSFAAGLGALVHCRSRSLGSGRLYECYRGLISRQSIRLAVEQARQDANRSERSRQRNIHWLVPGSVWSMDMFEFERDTRGRRIFIHQVQDLASRYKLSPIGGSCPCGEEIAAHLDAMICENGAPLFIKRDNGGNYNHPAVDEVLAKHLVLPLNSPVAYPQYNGGIEHAQGELKERMRVLVQVSGGVLQENIEPYAKAAAQELNHLSRPVLQGKTACLRFHGSKRISFVRTERRDIFDCVNSLKDAILRSMDNQDTNHAETAWRLAAAHWL
jgi:transposase InsO family protein